MSFFAFEFEGFVQRHAVGKYDYTVVFLPPELADRLPFDQGPRLRMRGEINDHPIEAAWQPARGRYYVMLSKTLIKEAGLAPGSRVQVRFALVDQDAVEIPADLQRIANEDSRFGAIWNELSAGKKRGFVYWLNAAKTVQTRNRRLTRLVEGLAENPNAGPMELVRAARAAP